MKKALVVGIDDYSSAPLNGCVNDAISIANTLERNGDGSPNFSVRLITSNETHVSSERLSDAIADLFQGDAETALFFFAGHGIINQETNAGYIVSQDGRRGAWGVALSDILSMANKAYPRIKSTVIILDSCHSGFAGEVQALGDNGISAIGNGVTILTACHREGTAAEANGHGLFTEMLLDGLSGSSADICGRITPASVYSHIDQTLGPWEQRPIYKANVQTFVTLREVSPKIPKEVLRRLPEYFPDATYEFPLDPSFEPDRENIPEELRHIPVNENNARVFKELQMCNRHGLVVPLNAEHMYYAAINSTGCKLTALGAHYRKLAEMKRI
ncbi:caspase family protein [Methylocaldum sp.]|uniref:caspase family protein n=1 Tax=Methylocaldum sp. TaxID=1969727 RepID=UPI002D3656C7|nr:caspase family protein [Methylocaldum sp.]HYE33860.1 caspase family protein [Methylocaldum sp.]